MTTTYAPVSSRKRFWTRKKIVITGVIAAVAVPGAAWAAVQLFGLGDFNVSAANAATANQNITVDNVQTVGTLVPGATVDAKGIVHNNNDFPISVTDIIVQDAGLTATGGGNCTTPGIVTVGGEHHASYAFSEIGGGYQFHLATPVSVAAHGAAFVTAPAAVTESASGTAFCGFSGHVAVLADSSSS